MCGVYIESFNFQITIVIVVTGPVRSSSNFGARLECGRTVFKLGRSRIWYSSGFPARQKNRVSAGTGLPVIRIP